MRHYNSTFAHVKGCFFSNCLQISVGVRVCARSCGRLGFVRLRFWLALIVALDPANKSLIGKTNCAFGKILFDIALCSGKLSTRWRESVGSTLKWAVSSGGEHYLDTVGVTSSNLVSPTMNLQVRALFALAFFVFPRTSAAQMCKPCANRVPIGFGAMPFSAC